MDEILRQPLSPAQSEADEYRSKTVNGAATQPIPPTNVAFTNVVTKTD
jgi:hypothetical protein